jgi:hypothetical protein
MAVEIRQRHQGRGVLTGIEALALRIAVGVNHVAVKHRAHGRDLGQQPGIELVNMPIRIRQQPTVFVQPVGDGIGHICSRMRQAQNNRACALINFDRGHVI